jgi:hypothetical protein
MRYFWLALAFLVAVAGVLVGRALSLPRPVTATLTGALTILAMFPFMKPWLPKTSFSLWAITSAIGAVVAWLLYLGFSRLGF